MARIAEALQTFPYVSRVQINLNAGTIIVHHDEEALEDIKSKLKDLGVILMAAVGVETSSLSLSDAVSDIARHLGLGTKGILNLKLLVPLGFGALAVLQLARQGLQFGSAPWYLIAYFAFDSYIKLNSPEEKCSPVGSTAGE
jgi:copper chaperone CopZ